MKQDIRVLIRRAETPAHGNWLKLYQLQVPVFIYKPLIPTIMIDIMVGIKIDADFQFGFIATSFWEGWSCSVAVKYYSSIGYNVKS
jgi:hypothetical protein